MTDYEQTMWQQTFNPLYSVDGLLVAASENHWSQPPKWNRNARREGTIQRVLCSYSIDLFQKENSNIFHKKSRLPLWKRGPIGSWKPSKDRIFPSDQLVTISDVRSRILDIIQSCKNIDWLLVTDYPENFVKMMPESWKESLPNNVWVGTSIQTQHEANERIPHLLKIPAAVRFLSCEPLLTTVELGLMRNAPGRITRDYRPTHEFIDWVIIGGESGPNARPCNIEHVRSLRDQCKKAGVACFVKQLGSRPIAYGRCDCGRIEHGRCHQLCPSITPQRVSLCDPKGANPAEWPEDLRVREIPE